MTRYFIMFYGPEDGLSGWDEKSNAFAAETPEQLEGFAGMFLLHNDMPGDLFTLEDARALMSGAETDAKELTHGGMAFTVQGLTRSEYDRATFPEIYGGRA